MNKAEDQTRQKLDDYKRTFGDEAGLRVLEDLCQFAQYQTPSFDEAEDTSARKMAFREGQRSVVSYIQTWIEMERAELQEKLRQTYQQTDEEA
jgi:hypothetical protein